MTLKPDGKKLVIAEQIIEDPVTELTFQFESMRDGRSKLLIVGDSLPFGNREIIFDENGEECGAGTGLCCTPRPSWLQAVGARSSEAEPLAHNQTDAGSNQGGPASMSYARGDLVLATVLGGEQVERRVWGVREDARVGTVIDICTDETYQEALASGIEPVIVGFRAQWIEPQPA